MARATLGRTWHDADGAYRGLAIALGVGVDELWDEAGGNGGSDDGSHVLWCSGSLERDPDR